MDILTSVGIALALGFLHCAAGLLTEGAGGGGKIQGREHQLEGCIHMEGIFKKNLSAVLTSATRGTGKAAEHGKELLGLSVKFLGRLIRSC